MHPQQSWYDFEVAQELFIYEINKLTIKIWDFLSEAAATDTGQLL